MTRNYTERKARRALYYRFNVQKKLDRSLQSRTKREKEWAESIEKINSAYVYVKCKVCGTQIRVEFDYWQKGNYYSTCRDCINKENMYNLKKFLEQAYFLVPTGYELKIIRSYSSDPSYLVLQKQRR